MSFYQKKKGWGGGGVCRSPACGDSKHSIAWMEFGLAIICHSCDNACWLQVCDRPNCVYLEMNLKAAGLGRHTTPAK